MPHPAAGRSGDDQFVRFLATSDEPDRLPDGRRTDSATDLLEQPRTRSRRATALWVAAGLALGTALAINAVTAAQRTKHTAVPSSPATSESATAAVCLSGFIGTGNGSDPRIARAEELMLAPSVIVH